MKVRELTSRGAIIFFLFTQTFLFAFTSVSNQVMLIFSCLAAVLLLLLSISSISRTRFRYKSTIFWILILIISGFIMSVTHLGIQLVLIQKILVLLLFTTTTISISAQFHNDCDAMISIFLFFGIVSSSLTAIQSLLYNYFQINLIIGNEVILRNGNLRWCLGEGVISLATLLAIYIISSGQKKHRKASFIMIILSTFVTIYSIQTRQLILAYFLAIVVQLLFSTSFKKEINIKTLSIVILFIFVAYVSGLFTYLAKIISSFLESGTEFSDSNKTRSVEIAWYYHEVIPRFFPFGIGFYDEVPGSNILLYSRGPQGWFFTSDIGIIGDIVNYGIFAIFAFFAILRNLYLSIKVNNKLILFLVFFGYQQSTTLSYFLFYGTMERFATLLMMIGIISGLIKKNEKISLEDNRLAEDG